MGNVVELDKRTPCKVVLVSATFKLDRSYQENIWAESLADMGHEVTVCAPVNEVHQVGRSRISTLGSAGYDVRSVHSFMLPQNNVLTRDLADHVLACNPDLVVWFGAIMYFGRSLYLDDRLEKIPVVTVYSLSRRGRHPFCWYGRAGSWRERAKSLAFQVLRAPVLTRSLRRAQLTVANTPECTNIIRQYVWGEERVKWAHKHIEIPLGFCPHTFSYQPLLRRQARQVLSLSNQDTVLLFSTRFAPDKWPALEGCFHAVELGLSEGEMSSRSDVHMIWVGADQGETTQRFRNLIGRANDPQRHHLISFQSRERLATWYHTADVILFPQPSISVQEAMGTGAHIICPPDPSLNHLRNYSSRIDYLLMSHWPDRIKEICRNVHDHEVKDEVRESAARDAQALSYPYLIQNVLDELDHRLKSSPVH